MSEDIAPGVALDVVSFRSKPIERVSTTTAGFVGPTRFGPTRPGPRAITGLSEFERIYGDGRQLDFSDAGRMHNYVWHAARAFFAQGGRQLYVSRTYRPGSGSNDGIARAHVPAAGGASALEVRARFPGAAGNIRVRMTVRIGGNILSGATDAGRIAGLQANDVVWIRGIPGRATASAHSGELYVAAWDRTGQTWRFGKSRTASASDRGPRTTAGPSSALTALDLADGGEVRIVTLAVTVLLQDGSTLAWDGLQPDVAHERADRRDGLCARFDAACNDRDDACAPPLVITAGTDVSDGLDVLDALVAASPHLRAALDSASGSDADRSIDVMLSGGDDGARPTIAEYEGCDDPATGIRTGLRAFEDIEDISIVAAPGATFGFKDRSHADASAIASRLISHAEGMRYRIAVLDSGDGLGISEVRAMRAGYDSARAAFYYPWVRVQDPITGQEIDLPPSGFVSGIYVRNDLERGVCKAPANEVVNLAQGLEIVLTEAQESALNPEGINCLRFLPGLGYRLWGARTMSSDPGWQYVNLSRYFAYLEHSIDRGTQWAVFESNNDALWARMRCTVESFLLDEWKAGALSGNTPEMAFFVRCDRSTMTQNDLDNGRLICSIGVAPQRPAEFVIIRIGQWTADRK